MNEKSGRNKERRTRKIPQHTISSSVKQEKQSTGESQNNSFIKMKPKDFFKSTKTKLSKPKKKKTF